MLGCIAITPNVCDSRADRRRGCIEDAGSGPVAGTASGVLNTFRQTILLVAAILANSPCASWSGQPTDRPHRSTGTQTTMFYGGIS
jgi:hypothetical protein